MHTFFLCLILAVERMRSYKYNRVHTTSFACSTGTITLSCDRPTQYYYRLLPTDGSRGLRAIADDCTFIWAVGCNLEDWLWPTCSALHSPKPLVFLKSSISGFFSTYYVLKWGIMAMMGLWQYIAIALLVSLKSGRCHKLLSYKHTLFYKHIFSYRSDL